MLGLVRLPDAANLGSWDAIIGRVERSPPESRVAAAAFFRSHLGEDWPGLIESRPLSRAFMCSGPTGRTEAEELHELLRGIGDAAGLAELISSAGSSDWNKYVSAWMTADLASNARARGLRPRVLVAESKKVADLTIEIGDRTFAVECTALNLDEGSQAFDEMFAGLFSRVSRGALLGRTGKLVLHIDGHFSEALRVAVERAAVEALDRGTTSSSVVAPGVSVDFVESRAPLSIDVFPGPIVANDFKRLCSRLWRKQRQVEVHLDGSSPVVCDAGGIVVRTFSLLSLASPAKVAEIGRALGVVLKDGVARGFPAGFVFAYEDIHASPFGVGVHVEGDVVVGRVERRPNTVRTFVAVRVEGSWPVVRDGSNSTFGRGPTAGSRRGGRVRSLFRTGSTSRIG